ncbi:MAG: putative methyltransferase [Actinomycetia bacterium]|nr:putative methyltransferase [Actinomycetes bacterium]
MCPGTGFARLSYGQARALLDEYTALWKGGLGEDAPDWLTRHGWQPHFHDLATLAASYGRPIPGPANGGFITAVRVEEQHARAL